MDEKSIEIISDFLYWIGAFLINISAVMFMYISPFGFGTGLILGASLALDLIGFICFVPSTNDLRDIIKHE